MKKCNDCGETKGLKSGWVDDDLTGHRDCCFCKNCFFDNEYENESDVTKENWDDYDYHWTLKISKSKFYCKFCKKIIRIAFQLHMQDNHNVRNTLEVDRS